MGFLKRSMRWLIRGALMLVVGVVGLIAAVLAGISSDAGNERIREEILKAAAPSFPEGELAIGRVDTNLLGHFDLFDVEIRDAKGKALVHLDRFALGYELLPLLSRRLVVDTVRLEGPVLDLTVMEDGNIDLVAVFGPASEDEEETPPSGPWEGLPIDVSVPKIAIVDGAIALNDPEQSVRIADLDLSFGIALEGSTVRVEAVSLGIDLDEPYDLMVGLDGDLALKEGALEISGLVLNLDEIALSVEGRIGAVETQPDLDLTLAVDPIAPDTVEVFAGEPVLLVPVALNAKVKGLLSSLDVDAQVTGPDIGVLGLKAHAKLEAEPLSWAVEVLPEAFQVHALTSAVPGPFILNGRYAVEGTGTEWPAEVEAKIDLAGGEQVFAGELVHSLVLQGELAGGKLQLNTLTVDHAAVDLDVRGVADLVASTSKLDMDVVIPSARALGRYGVEGMSGRIAFSGAVDAGWDPEVLATLNGDLSLSNMQGQGVSLVRGGGPITARVEGENATGNGTVTLEGLDASGTTIDTITLDFSGGQSSDGNISASAQVGIDHIAMPADAFEMEALNGTMTATIPSQGDMVADADLNVGRFKFGGGEYEVEGGRVDVDLAGDLVGVDIDLRRSDTPFVAGHIAGDLKTGVWDISGFEFAVIADDGMSAQQDIQFTLTDGGAVGVVFDLANPGGRGRLRVEGDATVEAPNLHLTAETVEVAYIVDMIDEVVSVAKPKAVEGDEAQSASDAPASSVNPMAGMGGVASMDLVIRKEEGVLLAEGWVELKDLVVPEQVDGLDIRVDLALTGEQGTVTLRAHEEEKTLLWTDGQVSLIQERDTVMLDCDGTIALRAVAPAMKFRNVAKVLPVLGDELRGRASMDFEATGSACAPDLRLVAAVDTPIGPQGERARIDVVMNQDGPDINLETTVEQDSRQMLRLDVELATQLPTLLDKLLRDGVEVDFADVNTWLEHFDVAVAIQSADLGQLARLGEVTHPISGVLGGGVRIEGTMAEPVATGGFVVVNGRIGAAQMEQAAITLVPNENGYDFSTLLGFVDTGGLSIDGTIPIELRFDEDLDLTRSGLDVKVSGAGIPIALAAGPGGLTDPIGVVQLDGSVGGTLVAPIPTFHVSSEELGFTLADTALRYEPIEMDIQFSPDRLEIGEFSIRTMQLWGAQQNTGTFRVTGEVALEDGSPTSVDVRTKMDEFWLSSTRQAALAMSGDVSVKGEWPKLKVRGDLSMDEARFEFGEEVLKETSGLEIDPDIVISRTRREVVAAKREEEDDTPGVADEMSMDLTIDLHQAVRVKADVPMSEDFGSQFAQLAALNVDIGVDGKLRVQQEQGVLSVVGEVETLRGEALALGKRFILREGLITFTGENYTNPMLDMEASHQVGAYGTVDIHILGDVESTTMELSSPDYPDQTDVMSMLLFGKPTSAMSETEGESGSGLLSAAMASVGGQAARATGAAFLQNVQVDPGSGSVKVGFPLSDKVYLSIQRMKPASDTDNLTQAALEWLLARSAYAELITGDKGKSSGDVYFRWRF